MTQKKLTKKQVLTIKKLYMEYKPIAAIAREFKVQRSSIVWHINTNGWKEERKLNENEIFSAFDDSKKVDFVEMTRSATEIMARSLKNLATRAEPPTINEATRAADILKTLDNILRLDEGKPTDIVENSEKPLTSKELKEKLKVDPFADLEEEEDEITQ